MSNIVKKEYQQYEDGPHVCITDMEGNWLADCGIEGNEQAENVAQRILTLWNEWDRLKGYAEFLLGHFASSCTDDEGEINSGDQQKLDEIGNYLIKLPS